MNKLDKLNAFLNDLDVVGIASDTHNEYDLEANSLVENFSDEMGLSDLSELFTECMNHFFSIEHVLTHDDLSELHTILKSQ